MHIQPSVVMNETQTTSSLPPTSTALITPPAWTTPPTSSTGPIRPLDRSASETRRNQVMQSRQKMAAQDTIAFADCSRVQIESEHHKSRGALYVDPSASNNSVKR